MLHFLKSVLQGSQIVGKGQKRSFDTSQNNCIKSVLHKETELKSARKERSFFRTYSQTLCSCHRAPSPVLFTPQMTTARKVRSYQARLRTWGKSLAEWLRYRNEFVQQPTNTYRQQFVQIFLHIMCTNVVFFVRCIFSFVTSIFQQL